MSGIVQLVRWNYDQILQETVEDERVDGWFLMESPWPVVSLLLFYLYFVLHLGPKLMENRKPFNLKFIMVLYNLYQVVFSTWLCSRLFLTKNALTYLVKHSCHPMERSENPMTMEFYGAVWYYFLSKVIELLDTVFFVLRKKQNQVSVLHVYHHTIMVISTWAYLKYIKGEQGVLIGFLNSFVHVVMYSYYLLAALGPQVQKYLWWKKYITKLQLAQFIMVITYLSTLLAMDCSLPKALSVYMAFNTFIFLAMFLNFYRKTYVEKTAVSSGAESATSSNQSPKSKTS